MKNLIKHIGLITLTSLFFTGCATTAQKEEGAKADAAVATLKEELVASKNVAQLSINQLEALKVASVSWTQYELLAVTLDKTKKPTASKSFELVDSLNLYPFDKLGPKINLSTFSTASSEGKIIQINCKNVDIKQKFDTALALSGWAVEANCDKNSYFFMINKKKMPSNE